MDENLTDSQTMAIAYAIVILLSVLTSWWAGRRARRALGRALGRDIRSGEETSLRAWMSVPAEALPTVEDELRRRAAERVLDAAARMPRRGRRADDHQPYSEHLSIR